MEILFCGDFAPCHNYEKLLIEKRKDLFGEIVQDIEKADISFLNLETPLTLHNNKIIKSGPALKANPVCADVIAEAGFTIAGLANNHILDYQAEGLVDTLLYLRKSGVKLVGAGVNLCEAINPLIMYINEHKIAFIAVAEHEFSIAGPARAGAAPLDLMELTEQVEDLKNSCQLIFVTIHGGNEYFAYPRPGLRKICRYLVRRGVDGVVCHHSHTPGVYEIYEGKPISYGLGNFIFDSINHAPAGWSTGYAVNLIYDNNFLLNKFELIPYTQSVALGGIVKLKGPEKNYFISNLKDMNKKLLNENDYHKQWVGYYKQKELGILLRLFVHPKFRGASRLRHWTPLIKKMISKKSVAWLLNMFRCESHREMVLSILED